MRKKLIALSAAISLLALCLVSGVGVYFAQKAVFEASRVDIVRITDAYAVAYSPSWESSDIEDKGVRLTVISDEGVVLLDSLTEDVSTMENHLEREEIQNALAGNPNGAVVRSSPTLGVEMLYYAEMVDSGDTYVFLRVSMMISSIRGYLLSYLPWLVIVTLTAVALVVVLSVWISSYSLKPLHDFGDRVGAIKSGVYETNAKSYRDKEVDAIATSLDEIGVSLSQTIKELNAEQRRLSLILENISDGILALDKEDHVLLLNKVAREIFEAEEGAVGAKLRTLGVGEELLLALEKGEMRFDYATHGRVYLCVCTLMEKGRLIVLSDVTSEREASKTRKDFFDSASHELKTPLTSIRGFNDLISLSSDDQKIKDYCALIDRESLRMVNLVTDMLQLSEIEKKKDTCPAPISLSNVVNEVVNDLSPIYEKKDVKVSYEGETLLAIEADDAYSLIKNLLENAVKYNHEGGEASVYIYEDRLIVEDDGAGIPLEDQPHVFERFYRVDKSRSREDGGTGLGLSIVKHICVVYGYELKLESTPGLGSKFTVVFKKG